MICATPSSRPKSESTRSAFTTEIYPPAGLVSNYADHVGSLANQIVRTCKNEEAVMAARSETRRLT